MAKTYEAMQKIGRETSIGWRFFDLKNRKQTGDLEKKIIQYKKRDHFKIFNFTSARRKEGVSTVLANLVNYFRIQDNEKKVLIIDANSHSPSLHHVFDTQLSPGLAEALSNSDNINDIFRTINSTNISLLTCGQVLTGHTQYTNQEKLAALLSRCKDQFDYIFIDSPPILTSSDALSIAMSSDITFMVLQSTVVQKEVALKVKDILESNECIIGGVILNRIKQVIPNWIYSIL